MNRDSAVIQFCDKIGNLQTRDVSPPRSIFDFPEAFPEAHRPGSSIVTQGTIYWYDKMGNMRHCDNR